MSHANPPTFRELYQKYIGPIYNYIYYRSGRRKEIAEDLASEIFLKAFEKFDTFNPETSSFQSWIYTIAHNHLIDHYRLSKNIVPLDKVENIISINIDVGAKIDRKTLSKLVLSEVDKLPTAYREILTLKFVSDLSNQEIGEILQKNPGSVRVTLHRAQEALKKKINNTPDPTHERSQSRTDRELLKKPANNEA